MLKVVAAKKIVSANGVFEQNPFVFLVQVECGEVAEETVSFHLKHLQRATDLVCFPFSSMICFYSLVSTQRYSTIEMPDDSASTR